MNRVPECFDLPRGPRAEYASLVNSLLDVAPEGLAAGTDPRKTPRHRHPCVLRSPRSTEPGACAVQGGISYYKRVNLDEVRALGIERVVEATPVRGYGGYA